MQIRTRAPLFFRFCLGLAAVPAGIGLMTAPAAAGGGELAAGLLGGFAAGAVVGSAAAQPHYYAPYYYYPPAPVYVPAPRCWMEERQVFDGYGYVLRPLRVCE